MIDNFLKYDYLFNQRIIFIRNNNKINNVL